MRTHAPRVPSVVAPLAAMKPLRAHPAVRAILRGQPIQPKLKIGAVDDPLEREADRVAALVIRMPAPELSIAATPPHLSRKCADCEEEEEKLQRKPAGPQSVAGEAPAIVHEVLRSPGEPLDDATRAFMEARFGYDFCGVRVHSDAAAEQSARDLNANAYAVGHDVVFGTGRFAPGTLEGRRLIAHELTHVVQQRGSDGIRVGKSNEKRDLSPIPQLQVAQRQPIPAVRSQTIPTELRSSANVARMSDEELTARHDWILEVLGGFTESTPDTVPLEDEAARIGVELGRRKALAAGRTFTEESIERMKDYFLKNARKPAKPRKNPPPAPQGGWQDSCIVALNKGMKIVTSKPALPTTPETIEQTMAKIAASGHSGLAREVWFEGKGGRITRGGARPEKLQASIWDTVMSLTGSDPGWSVFTMSIDDGNHSVTLTLDANDPRAPRMYWSDQWGTKKGWKEYTRSALDAEVTRLVQSWWDEQKEGRKFKPVVRVWRVRATPAISSGP
jgi:hypothetical protein